jgi:hypothetical protein
MSRRHFLFGIAVGGALVATVTAFIPRKKEVPSERAHELVQVMPATNDQPVPTAGEAIGTRPSSSASVPAAPVPPHVLANAALPPAVRTVEPVLAPVPGLSVEHASLLLPSPLGREPVTVPELHAKFAAEPKEPNWAYKMEEVLGGFIKGPRTDVAFDIVSIECRKTMCEILAFGNTPNAQERWQSIGAEMAQQEWWSGFRGNATSYTSQNGRTVLATILQRARQ